MDFRGFRYLFPVHYALKGKNSKDKYFYMVIFKKKVTLKRNIIMTSLKSKKLDVFMISKDFEWDFL